MSETEEEEPSPSEDDSEGELLGCSELGRFPGTCCHKTTWSCSGSIFKPGSKQCGARAGCSCKEGT